MCRYCWAYETHLLLLRVKVRVKVEVKKWNKMETFFSENPKESTFSDDLWSRLRMFLGSLRFFSFLTIFLPYEKFHFYFAMTNQKRVYHIYRSNFSSISKWIGMFLIYIKSNQLLAIVAVFIEKLLLLYYLNKLSLILFRLISFIYQKSFYCIEVFSGVFGY